VAGVVVVDCEIVGAVYSSEFEVVLEIVVFEIVMLLYDPSLRTRSATPWSEELIDPRAKYPRGNFWDASAKARAQANAPNAFCIVNSTCSY
jgi:hypothetical protein